MSFIQNLILKLSRGLYPTGRAFRMLSGSTMEKVHKGLAVSESAAYEYGISVLDSILPDNPDFTEQDAENWERRLSIPIEEGTSLNDRKSAIIRKMNYPGSAPQRGNYLVLQNELQKAGFNLYVHENRFPIPDIFISSQSSTSLFYKSLLGDESGTQDLSTETNSILGIQYYNENIFILDLTGGVYRIKKFDLDFNELNSDIFPGIDARRFYIYNDRFYLFVGSDVIVYDFISELPIPAEDWQTGIIASCENIFCYNGKGYISDLSSSLVRVFDLNTTLQELTVSIASVNYVYVDDDYIYATNFNDELSRNDLDGTNRIVIDDSSSDGITPKSITKYREKIYVGYLDSGVLKIFNKSDSLQGTLDSGLSNSSLITSSLDVIKYETRTPDNILNTILYQQHGPNVQAGPAVQHGIVNYNFKIVNSMDDPVDAAFDIGSNYRSTFFIGAEVLGDFADVDENRKKELRKLILDLKPVQTVAYTFINYI